MIRVDISRHVNVHAVVNVESIGEAPEQTLGAADLADENPELGGDPFDVGVVSREASEIEPTKVQMVLELLELACQVLRYLTESARGPPAPAAAPSCHPPCHDSPKSAAMPLPRRWFLRVFLRFLRSRAHASKRAGSPEMPKE